MNGKEPVPCDDSEIWQAFIDDIAGRTVARDIVGNFEILTTFLGHNRGDTESPQFFETVALDPDNQNPPFYSDTWEASELMHRKVVDSLIRLNAITEEDIANGHRFVGYGVQSDRLWFVMESEETAIAALSEETPNWHREGNTIVFTPPAD
ncbi:MAG: hypothetical protein F6K00_33790 [Leptolyngbya sp. SIOISBB]|nr:hypothetical protein [Leptolyngbya sp. SIOISBB]